jgi:hypothetical protein
MPRFNFRSSVTGRFVTRLFALLFPHVTVREKVGKTNEGREA